MPSIRFVGVDVSARRGLDVAELDRSGWVVSLLKLFQTEEVVELIVGSPGQAIVAVDAPQARRLAPRLRECDRDLRSRNVALYQVPRQNAPLTPAQSWIAVGFQLFRRLEAAGFRRPAASCDPAANLLEVYPYACFTVLLGHLPARKSTPAGLEQRQEALSRGGVRGVPKPAGHDVLDALVAALTALRHFRGESVSLGDTLDGFLTLPVPATELLPRYVAA